MNLEIHINNYRNHVEYFEAVNAIDVRYNRRDFRYRLEKSFIGQVILHLFFCTLLVPNRTRTEWRKHYIWLHDNRPQDINSREYRIWNSAMGRVSSNLPRFTYHPHHGSRFNFRPLDYIGPVFRFFANVAVSVITAPRPTPVVHFHPTRPSRVIPTVNMSPSFPRPVTTINAAPQTFPINSRPASYHPQTSSRPSMPASAPSSSQPTFNARPTSWNPASMASPPAFNSRPTSLPPQFRK